MIFDPGTVLVLGAGASAPYGFPLGRELKDKIINNTVTTSAKPHPRYKFLEAGFGEEEISDFHEDLNRSIHFTIDDFLEERTDWRDIGTFAIAQVLMPLERDNELFPPKDWYPKLFKELKLRDYSNAANVTAIVTLNYDRSVDHYLRETAIRSYVGETRTKVLEKLATVKVIHVHGQLGQYPEMPYVQERTIEDIKKGAEGISMAHDHQLDNSEAFKDAAQFIATAAYVLFLGCGYDLRTLKRLGVFDVRQGLTFYGTTNGLEHDWMDKVQKLFENRIDLDNNHALISLYLDRFVSMKLEKKQKKV